MSRALLPFDELEQLFVKGGDLRAVDAIVGVKHAIDEIQVLIGISVAALDVALGFLCHFLVVL